MTAASRHQALVEGRRSGAGTSSLDIVGPAADGASSPADLGVRL